MFNLMLLFLKKQILTIRAIQRDIGWPSKQGKKYSVKTLKKSFGSLEGNSLKAMESDPFAFPKARGNVFPSQADILLNV